MGGEPERNARVPCKREREQQADLFFSESRFGEVKHENDGKKSVAKQADDTGCKEQGNIFTMGHARII